MNTCETCAAWTQEEPRGCARLPKGFGYCVSPKFYYTGDGTDDPAEGEVDCLTYWDCEGYGAGFETGKDFGCIHWTKKGDPE